MALIYNGSQINSLVWNGTETTGVWNGSVVWEPFPPGPSFDEVTIGTQTWMAKNLAIDDGQGGISAMDNVAANGVNFGTQYYYTWDAAVRVANNVEGWHLPTTTEFSTLESNAGGYKVVGNKLKSTGGWDNGSNGTDDYGFNALPVGRYTKWGTIFNLGYQTNLWTSTENSTTYATNRRFDAGPNTSARMNSTNDEKTQLFSVRLIKDT